MVEKNELVEIIRRRIENASPSEHSIPNCDVRLLLMEVDRLTEIALRLGSTYTYRP